jgi:hypothetical protein
MDSTYTTETAAAAIAAGKTTRCVVLRANGDPSTEYDTNQAAVTALSMEYPYGVCYDAGGFPRDADDTDHTYDVRSGRVALYWLCEAESVQDDGANAVAEIMTREADADGQ